MDDAHKKPSNQWREGSGSLKIGSLWGNHSDCITGDKQQEQQRINHDSLAKLGEDVAMQHLSALQCMDRQSLRVISNTSPLGKSLKIKVQA